MAAPTNTYSTAVAKGNREDLENTIYRVAVDEIPFIKAIGSTSAKAVKHEWQTETLAAPNASNATLEGDDVSSFDAGNNTTRVSNTCKIFRKTGVISGTQEAVTTAGRASDIARQKLLKGKEIMLDMEARFIGNYAEKVDEASSTPRTAAGALAWLTSNTSKGTGGADGGYSSGVTSAATNGTQRAFTETLLKGVLAKAADNGAKVNGMKMFVGSFNKQAASGFTGIAAQRHEVGSGKVEVIAGADVYVSDFGAVQFVYHPYCSTRDAFLADTDMWAVATLRPLDSSELSKTGDNYKFTMIAEKTLVCRNEKSSAVVRDLTNS